MCIFEVMLFILMWDFNMCTTKKWKDTRICGSLWSTYRIGQFVSTKAVGKNAREDVTHLYKYAESKYIMEKLYFLT